MSSVSEAELPRTEMEMYEKGTGDEMQGDVQGDSEIFCSPARPCPLA